MVLDVVDQCCNYGVEQSLVEKKVSLRSTTGLFLLNYHQVVHKALIV